LGKIFRELNPYAKSLSLKLALENLSYASSGFGKNVTEIEEILETKAIIEKILSEKCGAGCGI